MPAFYGSSVQEFLASAEDATAVVGRLTSEAARAGFFQQVHTQTSSWLEQVKLLRTAFRAIESTRSIEGWHLLLEFPIPRRSKRIDCVLLADGVIVVLEFKCGASEIPRDAVIQVEDYCLDLRDFHQPSFGRTLIPFIIATGAKSRTRPAVTEVVDFVGPVWTSNAIDLASTIIECVTLHGSGDIEPIDAARWNLGEYSPTPTIIEAAQALYAGQNVREISRCHSGAENLTRTTDAVIGAIERAKVRKKKLICFVTGVPGAGKTLAGLNVVHNKQIHEDDLGVFLSGNVPLVRVLREALARDHAARVQGSKQESRRKVETFIQNVHRFIGEHFPRETPPKDNVVIFDEAQRAWDKEQSMRKFERPFSESEVMLEIMSRHDEWAVIVALIGQGQEINSGEAGLGEWGRALHHFPEWEVLISPALKFNSDDLGSSVLFNEIPQNMIIHEDSALHLDVPLRSYKAEAVASFVDAVLNRDLLKAKSLIATLSDSFPILMTRSLDSARTWLKEKQRGSRRVGLVASSGARRLRAEGLDVTIDLDVENWFLNPSNDVRSSYSLEVPATEFGIQGLELDWIGLCWGGDLCPADDDWVCRRFVGTRWTTVQKEATRRYIVNKYRVLLTRAREGVIIFVPEGAEDDLTRSPKIYNGIAGFLAGCGIPALSDTASSSGQNK